MCLLDLYYANFNTIITQPTVLILMENIKKYHVPKVKALMRAQQCNTLCMSGKLQLTAYGTPDLASRNPRVPRNPLWELLI